MILRSKRITINDRELVLSSSHDTNTDNRKAHMRYSDTMDGKPLLHFTSNCKVYTTDKPEVLFGTMQFYKDEWFFNDGKQDYKFPESKMADYIKLEIAELETAELYLRQNPQLY